MEYLEFCCESRAVFDVKYKRQCQVQFLSANYWNVREMSVRRVSTLNLSYYSLQVLRIIVLSITRYEETKQRYVTDSC